MNTATRFSMALRKAATGLLIVASGLLAGCTAIPSSGPTGAQVRAQAVADINRLGIELIELKSADALPPAPRSPEGFGPDYTPPPPTELVGIGDVLDISIYETGISLFGRSSSGPIDQGFEPGAKVERLPPTLVSEEGTINIPFVGELRAAGRTTSEVERLIRASLRGKSQNPQVIVSIREGLTNSVIVGGDIARPGRLVLPTNRESLSDVIALAGGHRGEVKDILVRVQRNTAVAEFRLSDVMNSPDQNIRIFPGDRLSLVRTPRSFSALGAAGKAEQIGFPTADVTLAEAIALAGGPSAAVGDPRAIFVFRIYEGEEGRERPVVYHLNMMDVSAFPLAQRFPMADGDVLYIGNAEANQPIKLVQIVSQLFFPLVTLQNLTNF